MALDKDLLLDNICLEEGFEPVLYDDATGKLLGRGSRIVGNPTIGYGWNTSGKPISRERARVIASWFMQDALDDLFKALPWTADLPDGVQLGLADMSYNLGIDSLLKFSTFLSMLRAGNFTGAADDLTTTAWHKQVGSRALKIEQLIRQGN